MKDSGTGGEGLGQMLAALLLRAPGESRAEGSSLLCSSTDLGKLPAAGGRCLT